MTLADQIAEAEAALTACDAAQAEQRQELARQQAAIDEQRSALDAIRRPLADALTELRRKRAAEEHGWLGPWVKVVSNGLGEQWHRYDSTSTEQHWASRVVVLGSNRRTTIRGHAGPERGPYGTHEFHVGETVQLPPFTGDAAADLRRDMALLDAAAQRCAYKIADPVEASC